MRGPLTCGEPPFASPPQVLASFNSGDLDAYEKLCVKYAAQLNAQPALVAEERKLREKITILALMEIIARLPSDEHVVQLKSIAERTKLTVDGAEFLVMKALSVHLIEGAIDQVDGTVRISWVQPRVLLLPQARPPPSSRVCGCGCDAQCRRCCLGLQRSCVLSACHFPVWW